MWSSALPTSALSFLPGLQPKPHIEEGRSRFRGTPYEAFIQVLLPQLMPGIAAGCLLAFVLSLDDFLIASFTAGIELPSQWKSLAASARSQPDINAFSVILILGL